MLRFFLPLTLITGLFIVALLWRPGFETPPPFQPTFSPRDHFLNPYWPDLSSPKLVTPQWIGEPGVEAAAVLSIDDMRGIEPYQSYLEPILQALESIDGRAPVSIFTNQIDPNEPHLQGWLKRGLSIEVHTLAHPCPLLKDGDFTEARDTVQHCVDLLAEIPNMNPVAYRMPCCDSMNSVSPRFYAEIMAPLTPNGNFLSADSSVFQIFTQEDPELPRALFADGQGKRFERYVPLGKDYVNTIENYPYPYLIGKQHWQFPCTVPSDWEAQYLQGKNEPRTVEDLKAALDATVAKQGLFVFVFHPHGWIENGQVAELVRYAHATYGQRLKFLNLREVQERLDTHLLANHPVRNPDGTPSGTQLADLNGDGYMDVFHSDTSNERSWARLWNPNTLTWRQEEQARAPIDAVPLLDLDGDGRSDEPQGEALRFWDLDADGDLDAVYSDAERYAVYLAIDGQWSRLKAGPHAEAGGLVPPPFVRADGSNHGVWMGERSFIIQNEDTSDQPNVIQRIPFADILAVGEAASQTEAAPSLIEVKPLEPEAALASMQTHTELEVQLAVHEPQVMDPIDLAWGADGKLWVVEMADYPLGIDGAGSVGGRVRFLEDEDRDGRYEKSTLFMDALPYPTGVMAWKRGALVLAAPDLIYAEDTDGDGKADLRKILYTGFGEGNQQHRVNGLRWGLDNWIYLANGDSGGTIRSTQTGESVTLGSHDLRIRPEEGQLELVSGQTQFGRNRNDAGDWFGCNNSNPLWHYVMDQSALKRNPRFRPPRPLVHLPEVPGNAPVFPTSVTHERFNDFHTANCITSACGSMIYRASLLGEAYQNSAFIAEPVHNLVHRQVLTEQGVTFSGRRASNEQTSEFLTSTDTWFRPVAFRTAPDGALWVVDMYRHVIEHPEWIPHDWESQLDLRAGHDRGRLYRVAPKGHQAIAAPNLTALSNEALAVQLGHDSGTVRDLAQQLLLERQPTEAEPLLLPALASEDWKQRLHALATLDGLQSLSRQAIQSALHDSHFAVRRLAHRLAGELKGTWDFPAEETHPKVLLQRAITLGELDGQGRALAELALRSEDPFLWAACISSMPSDPEAFIETLREAKLTESLSPLVAWALATLPSPALLRQIGAPKAFSAWRADLVTPWLPDQRDEVAGLLEAATAAVTDAEQPASDRVSALRLLWAAEGTSRSLESLATLCRPEEPLSLKIAAVRLIAQHFPQEIGSWLRSNWSALEPPLRQELRQWLSSRPNVALEVVQSLKEQPQPDLARALAQHPDANVSAAARSLLDDAASPNHQTRMTEVVALNGQRAAGRAHFQQLCAVCHLLEGTGNAIGPDLTSLANPSDEFLLQAILQPNAAVEDKYLAYLAEATDGQASIGLLEGESGGAIQLRLANGERQEWLRSELRDLRSTGQSLMPPGLAEGLSHQDLADLIAYVQSARPPRKEFAFNRPEKILPTEDGRILALPATQASVHGPSLTFERRYLHLGTWKHVQDQAIWSFHCAQPGRYRVVVDFSCDRRSSGNTLALQIVGQKEPLLFEVPPTRNWNAFQESNAGILEIDRAGEHELVARSHGPIRNLLMDLRRITLERL